MYKIKLTLMKNVPNKLKMYFLNNTHHITQV